MNDVTQPVVWDVIERRKDRAGDVFTQPREGEEFHLERWAHISQDVKTWEGKTEKINMNEFNRREIKRKPEKKKE